ncbi:hypothetical protein J6590_048770 [Homalodisca vitripennis]|nr:hypothetical protein J6590_048770 [Homalodisca vitripennis]
MPHPGKVREESAGDTVYLMFRTIQAHPNNAEFGCFLSGGLLSYSVLDRVLCYWRWFRSRFQAVGVRCKRSVSALNVALQNETLRPTLNCRKHKQSPLKMVYYAHAHFLFQNGIVAWGWVSSTVVIQLRFCNATDLGTLWYPLQPPDDSGKRNEFLTTTFEF